MMTNSLREKSSYERFCDGSDYLYYEKYRFEHLLDGYDGRQGYIAFQPWTGGFNNIRMSFEILVCFAYLTNRTLVLPPTYSMYLVEGKSNISDFFQLEELGISFMTFEDFCALKNIEPERDELKRISTKLHEGSHERFVPILFNFNGLDPAPELVKGREVMSANHLFDESELIYFDQNILGNFYQSIVSSSDLELKRLIAKFVRYRPEIFELAHGFIRQLGSGNYSAIHIRRNDFQYKHVIKDADAILENIRGTIAEGTRIYVSTDHMDRDFFLPLADVYDLYFYADLVDQADADVPDRWLPLVEQLICTRANVFIGQALSTFSSYIYRLRGYMEDVENKNYYLNTEPYNPGLQVKFAEDQQYIATWARDYRDVFEL